ncbi:OmpA family protein [Microcoleus sp. EPA2]|uniref:OmpA family protein n=1 Tax=Microcoleus sp. EPA2 TaxID=2841654 RepID=UPI00312B8203
MTEFNLNSEEREPLENTDTDATNQIGSKAGEQLQELMKMLAELQLLKLKNESNEINLRCTKMSNNNNEEKNEPNQQWSFLIESPAIIPEVVTTEPENPSPKKIKKERLGTRKSQPQNEEVPSEETLEEAREKLKRLQQLLFERDLPEFYDNVLSVEQRLANFERLISDPDELLKLLTPLIPELLSGQVRELKSELREAIAPDGSPRINQSNIEAKVVELQNQIAILSQQKIPNSEQLIKGLTPIISDLLNRKLEESKLGVDSKIAPAVKEVINHQNGLEEKVLNIEHQVAHVQQRFQQQPEDLVKQLLPIINESLNRKISELKSELIQTVTPSAQVRIAWAEIEEKVLNIIEGRLLDQQPQIQQPEEIIGRVMPIITELLNRKIDESKLDLAALIEPLMASQSHQEVIKGQLLNVENKVNLIQKKQNSQPEEIMARLMPLMIESLNRKIDETKLEVREAIAPGINEAFQNSGIEAKILRNEHQIIEVQHETVAQLEGLMARIMPRISQVLLEKISEARVEIESAIGPAVDAIIQNKRIEERLGKIEQKIVAIEHRIYESTDLFTDLLKPLIDELMVGHHKQLEQSVIESILPLLDEVVNYNYQLNDKVENLERKLKDAQWGGNEEALVAKIKAIFLEMMLDTINESQEAFTETIAPIIDQVINNKTRENRQSMGIAISPAIPVGISHRINESPEEIAQAIAPEIASAVRRQINLNTEAMSDALYPIIGSTILKYMAETIQEINEKLEKAVSFEGITRKFKAKLQGISEAELLMKETTPSTVKAVFLIQKDSGLVITAVQQSQSEQLESEMVAGMLTAIRSFVNDCISQSGNIAEIDAIEYGTSTILLEVAGSCYLAVVVEGETRQWFKYKMRAIFKNIVQEYGSKIQSFNGDPASIPVEVNSELRKLIDTNVKPKSTQPKALLMVGFGLLGLIIVPWGIYQYRSGIERRLEAETNLALQSAPELSVYRLTADVKGKVAELSGRVPNQKLRSRALQIAQGVVPQLTLDNKIIAVEVPPDPVLVEADVKRTVALLNKVESIDISARYAAEKVTVEGSVLQAKDAQKITEAFAKIPGVKSVTNTVVIGSKPLSKAMGIRIYFGVGAATLPANDITQKMKEIKVFMAENKGKNLRVIGHSDFKSNPAENQRLALERAKNVKVALVNKGIDSDRIQVASSKSRPAGVAENQPLWLSRTVTFEVVN